MATKFDALFPDVLPECPGCPTDTARVAIKKAFRAFCIASTAYRADHASITPVTDEIATGQYQLTPPTETDIFSLVSPALFGTIEPIEYRSVQWLNLNQADWENRLGDHPEFFTLLPGNVLRVISAPITSTAGPIRVSMILIPSTGALNMDDSMYSLFGTDIANRAKAELMRMPNTTWHDPQQSLYYDALATAAEREAFSWAISGRFASKADRNQRVKPYFF